MASFLSALTPALREFIARQKMFFVASAPSGAGGRVNLSPKGIDTFRILADDQVAYLDLTGSGNETAAHILDNGRVTIMFCAFDDKPLILRLYGRGEVIRPHATLAPPEAPAPVAAPASSDAAQLSPSDREASRAWNDLIAHFPRLPGERQIIRLHIQSLQTSCGFGVPLYAFHGHRDQLTHWAERKGEAALREYRLAKNATSIDGLPAGAMV